MICYDKVYKIGIAAISTLGASGIIFSIGYYIKNQFSEDKLYGLLLVVVATLFILGLCVLFIKPIIIWWFIYKMYKKEVDDETKINHFNKHLGKIIKFQIKSDLKQKNEKGEDIKKLIKILSNIKED